MAKTSLADELALEPLKEENRRLQSENAKLRRKEHEYAEVVHSVAMAAALTVGRPEPIKPPAKDRRVKKREVALLHLTDWQLGAKTHNFDMEVCQARVRRAVQKTTAITSYKRDSGVPIDECHLLLGGDLLEGVTIFPGQVYEIEAGLYVQLFTTAKLVQEVVLSLLETFSTVMVTEVWGNHGRIGKKGEMPREDNVDRIICRIARDQIGSHAGLVWEEPEDEWERIVQIGRYRLKLIHGDQIGSWGKLPIYAIIQAALEWASARIDSERFDDLYLGHFHDAWNVPMKNGGFIYMTPSVESGKKYVKSQYRSLGYPRQRLHFVDPEKRRVTSPYLLDLDD